MNGYVIYRLVKDKPKNMKFAYIYAALVVVVFAMFYPVLTGKTVNVDYVTNCLRWVKTWVLISG
jgi:dolichyl-phosphate-mannose--protein O-mannosyl transferase